MTWADNGPEMARNGDEYRWHRWSKPASSPSSISVIERADQPDVPPDARKVPFGFSRVLGPVPTAAPAEPLRWEGDDA